jgi:hypothetical protein
MILPPVMSADGIALKDKLELLEREVVGLKGLLEVPNGLPIGQQVHALGEAMGILLAILQSVHPQLRMTGNPDFMARVLGITMVEKSPIVHPTPRLLRQ